MSRTPAKITQADVAREPMHRTFIYFMHAGEFVKIGRSNNWKARRAQMQVGSPYTIIALLILIGDADYEKKLHNRFRADHFRGEWFHMSPTIGTFIKENLCDCVAKSDKDELTLLANPKREIVL